MLGREDRLLAGPWAVELAHDPPNGAGAPCASAHEAHLSRPPLQRDVSCPLMPVWAVPAGGR